MRHTPYKWIFFLFLYSPIFAAPSVSSIPVAPGYSRIMFEPNSFSYYVQNLSLKNENEIFSYEKRDLSSHYESLGVIAKPLLFKEDLEQCADFTMRLWADYHKENKRLESLYLFNYSGSRQYFQKSKLSYEKFLRKAFVSTNSHSLKKGGQTITPSELQPGDLFVQNETGGIGHVSIVLDMAKGQSNPNIYLIGFSFMPAQEMHIEKAPPNRGKAGWFTYQGFLEHLADKYPYGKPVLRRF
jgi:hypothetical protein